MKTDATKRFQWVILVLHFLTISIAAVYNNEQTNKLTILMWSPYFDADVTNDYLNGCPELGCQISYDKSVQNRSAAIVFYDRTLNASDLLKASDRLPNQHFVFFLMESPYYKSNGPFEHLSKDFYTLTMSHRRDSDIYSPFGYFKRREHIEMDESKLLEIANRKKKMVVWMGSNCNAASKRHLYMNELSKHVSVDVYGKCGPNKCPKTELAYTEMDPCEQNFRENYKFYLAFENSVCQDFVTEKIYNRASMYLVPLVLNRTIYEAHLPPGSFIAADDFESPAQMANYLNYLNDNPGQYIKYFKWMQDYQTVAFPLGIHDGFCRLCQRLNDERQVGRIRISSKARNLDEWFVKESQCNPDFVVQLLQRAAITVTE